MEKNDNSIPQTTIEDTDILPFLEEEQARLAKLSTDIATIAVTDTLQQQLIASAENLVMSAIAAREVIVNLETEEEREEFGGEDSYETVWRYFLRGDATNLSRPRTIEEIWNHLEKNYDMTKEALESLSDTLEEWALDIEEDAKIKAGIDGRFQPYEGGFVFAQINRRAPAKEAAAPKQTLLPVPPSTVTPLKVEPQEVLSPIKIVAREIEAILKSTEEGDMRQSQVKKTLIANNVAHYSSPDQLQEIIDELVVRGDVFKFKRGLATHLSIVYRNNELHATDKRSQEKKGQEDLTIDMPLAVEILRAFCAPGTHVQQKLTLNELWRKIHNVEDKNRPIPESETSLIKQICKILKEIDLIDASGDKMGTSGTKTNSATSSKRRKSGTMIVYKVSLPSQQIKNELKDILDTSNAAAYIQEKLDAKISGSETSNR